MNELLTDKCKEKFDEFFESLLKDRMEQNAHTPDISLDEID